MSHIFQDAVGNLRTSVFSSEHTAAAGQLFSFGKIGFIVPGYPSCSKSGPFVQTATVPDIIDPNSREILQRLLRLFKVLKWESVGHSKL